MRQVINSQLKFGEVDIGQIRFDPRSRDDIPQILRGLQYIYVTEAVRAEVFALLERHVAPQISKDKGRPGLELWKILVMGVLRVDLNWDYDHLMEQVNQHRQIREMLGHPDIFDKYAYSLQTLKDNVRLLTPELLQAINEVVVKAGHGLVKKKESDMLRGRCDSFVVETDVHYPTDINLLFDAMRKVIGLTVYWCERDKVGGWRQHAYEMRQLKCLMRQAQQSRRSKGEEKKISKAYREYLAMAQRLLDKAGETLSGLKRKTVSDQLRANEIETYMAHARRQIDQTKRRVLQGEVIPHGEKVFSLFQPHTEWISKGKAGVPVEFGVRVCVMEDQYQFILHHRVMQKETDDAVAIAVVEASQKAFAALRSVSFDKGFHSPGNQEALGRMLDLLAMPRKGKLSEAARTHEESKVFRETRRKHSAVESAINALEVHGLDICLDHGIDGFERYVAMAVVARNIHRIGDVLKQQEEDKRIREKHRLQKRCANDGGFPEAA